MFQRFAVTFTASDSGHAHTTSTVELSEGVDPRQEIAQQIACRRYGRASMADHVEIDGLVEIGEPTATP
jgi:hypothetical protein